MEKNQETLIRAFVRAGIAAFEAMADDGPDRSRVHEYAEVRQTLYDDPTFHAALEDPNFVEACHYTLEETAALLRRSDNVRGIAPKLHSLAGFLTFLVPKPDLDDKVVVCLILMKTLLKQPRCGAWPMRHGSSSAERN